MKNEDEKKSINIKEPVTVYEKGKIPAILHVRMQKKVK
jgi:hypothetical protein